MNVLDKIFHGGAEALGDSRALASTVLAASIAEMGFAFYFAEELGLMLIPALVLGLCGSMISVAGLGMHGFVKESDVEDFAS